MQINISTVYIDKYDVIENNSNDLINNYLTGSEKLKYQRYLKIDDKINFLVGRILLRKSLILKLFDFEINDTGKPELPDCLYHFNITHTNGYIGIVWSQESKVGIDIEEMKETDYIDLLNIFASAAESDYVKSSLDHNELKTRFYKIWTLKEAYLKAIGIGLNNNIKSYCVMDLHNDNRYKCYYKILKNNYSLAVVTENNKSVEFVHDEKNMNFIGCL